MLADLAASISQTSLWYMVQPFGNPIVEPVAAAVSVVAAAVSVVVAAAAAVALAAAAAVSVDAVGVVVVVAVAAAVVLHFPPPVNKIIHMYLFKF